MYGEVVYDLWVFNQVHMNWIQTEHKFFNEPAWNTNQTHIEHKLFDLAWIEHELNLYCTQIVPWFPDWTQIECKLNLNSSVEPRLNMDWAQVEHKVSDLTQIEHELNTNCAQILWCNLDEHWLNTKTMDQDRSVLVSA